MSVGVSLHLAFVYTGCSSRFASAHREHMQTGKRRAKKKKDSSQNVLSPGDTFGQLLIRSAIFGFPRCNLSPCHGSCRFHSLGFAPVRSTQIRVQVRLREQKERKDPFESAPNRKCFYTRDTNVPLYCIFLPLFSSILCRPKNDFQSNFSPGIFWSGVYVSQPYTSVRRANLIQLGNTRQWLTPP